MICMLLEMEALSCLCLPRTGSIVAVCPYFVVSFSFHHLDCSYSVHICYTVKAVALRFQTSCKHHVQVKFAQQSVPQFSFALPGLI